MTPKTLKVEPTIHGKRYGYVIKNSQFPNKEGKVSAGLASKPPIAGPTKYKESNNYLFVQVHKHFPIMQKQILDWRNQ